MRFNFFQKLVFSCLISLMLLLLAGSVVRATGSGMGCPDWPTCWGCLIPPTSIEQVEFEKLDIKRFQKKAERQGRDPSEISIQSLKEEFNPKHTWIEFINRCLSLPLGFLSLWALVYVFTKKNFPWHLRINILGIFALILYNAWLGAKIVYSGLQPGTITAHMSMAMLLIAMMIYVITYSGDRSFIKEQPQLSRSASWIGLSLLLLVITEGVLGSQVRELTDELSKAYPDGDRSEWSEILNNSEVYRFHRSFSWVIFGLGIALPIYAFKNKTLKISEIAICLLVIAQMIMGLILSKVAVYGVIQVLHVFASGLLLVFSFFWLFTRRIRLY